MSIHKNLEHAVGSRWVFELDVDPPHISPARAIDFAGRCVASFTTAPLFTYPEWGAKVQPGLVSHAESRRDGREWILYCGRDASWASGAPFTQEHLARLLRPNHEAFVSPAERFLAREVRSTESVGCSGVRILFWRPMPFLPEILSSDMFMSMDLEGSEVLTGPYTLAGRRAGTVIVLTKNTVGHRIYPDGPSEICFVITRCAEDGVRLFEKGLVDVTCNPNLPASALRHYHATPHLRTGSLAMAGVLLLKRPELTSTISKAIRRGSICDSVGESVRPLYSLIDIFDSNTVEVNSDSAEDRMDLRISGEVMTIAYADFEPNGEVVRLIAENLTDTLGVRVKPQPLSYSSYLTELREKKFDFIYTIVQPAFPEPVSFVEQLLRMRPSESEVSSTALERLLQPNYEQRLDACRALLTEASSEIPVIPILRHDSKCLTSAAAQILHLFPDGILRPSLHIEESR